MYQHTMECPESHIAGPQSMLCRVFIKTYVSAHGVNVLKFIYNGTTKHAFELNFVAILLQVIFVEIFLQ